MKNLIHSCKHGHCKLGVTKLDKALEIIAENVKFEEKSYHCTICNEMIDVKVHDMVSFFLDEEYKI